MALDPNGASKKVAPTPAFDQQREGRAGQVVVSAYINIISGQYGFPKQYMA